MLTKINPIVLNPITNLNKTELTQGTGSNFEKTLGEALNKVNDLQVASAELDGKLASGKLEYLHQAMIMSEKASLALQLTLQLRNKALESYQEVMRTQL